MYLAPLFENDVPVGLVAAGMGISLVIGCLNKLYENQVVYLPLVEPRFEFEFALYWKRDHSLSLVDHFIDAAVNQIGTSCAPHALLPNEGRRR